jgi:Caspase domain
MFIKKVNKKISCFFLLFLCLYTFALTSKVEAADMHVLLVGDTTDNTLGYAFQLDLNLMHDEVKKISQATGMKLNLSLYSGKQVTTENILDHVDKLDVNPDDVVIIYFSVHGYRTIDKQNQWPNLYFGSQGQGLDFDLVNQIVKAKNPRLILTIADSCNNYLPAGYYVPTITKKDFNPEKESIIQKNYKKLFLESSGSIVISSSIPGQYSWAYTYKGGVYTLQFLKDLSLAVNNQEPAQWAKLLEDINMNVLVLTTQQTNQSQQPQYELLLK